jgi:homospermidine synthase
VLGSHLSAGDLLINLSWNVQTKEIIDWCHHHGVLYVDTSVEQWDPYQNQSRDTPT